MATAEMRAADRAAYLKSHPPVPRAPRAPRAARPPPPTRKPTAPADRVSSRVAALAATRAPTLLHELPAERLLFAEAVRLLGRRCVTADALDVISDGAPLDECFSVAFRTASFSFRSPWTAAKSRLAIAHFYRRVSRMHEEAEAGEMTPLGSSPSPLKTGSPRPSLCRRFYEPIAAALRQEEWRRRVWWYGDREDKLLRTVSREEAFALVSSKPPMWSSTPWAEEPTVEGGGGR